MICNLLYQSVSCCDACVMGLTMEAPPGFRGCEEYEKTFDEGSNTKFKLRENRKITLGCPQRRK